MIKWVDTLLVDWATWCRGLSRDCLGYPSRTAESRAGEGRNQNRPGPLVPHVMGPERLLEADRAIRDMPKGLRLAIEVRYLADLDRESQEAAWITRSGKSRRAYYHRLDSAHWWLDGRIGRERTENRLPY